MIIGPCTTNAIEQQNASFQIDRVFVAGRATEWFARLTLPDCYPDECFGPGLQTVLDSLELRTAQRREPRGCAA